MTAPGFDAAMRAVRSAHDSPRMLEQANRIADTMETRIAAAVAHLEALECQCRPVAVAGWPHTVGKCDRCQVLELLGGGE